MEIKNFQWEPSHVKRILRELPHLEELRLPILCSVSDKENTSPPINSRSNPINSTKLSHHHTNKYISKSGNTLSNWKSKNFSQNPCQTQESFCKLKRIIVTLTIRDLQFLDYKSAPIQPILDLIHLTPNLEEVYYPNIVQFTSPYDNPARVLLENIISSQSLCRLSTLKIDTFLTNADLRLLTAKGHAFKSLQLTLTPAIGVKYLYEFLQGSSSSLKSLTLTLRDGFKFTTAFPTLSPGLERMSLILWKGHFDFIPEIQKLKVLIIVLIEMEEEHFQKLKDFSSSKLEELEIHGNQRSKIDLAQVILTQIRGPCLIKLTLDWVDDSLLQIIFRMLPNLQELGILYGGFTQAGITGIGEKYCDKDGEIMAKRGLGIGDLKSKWKCVLIFSIFAKVAYHELLITLGLRALTLTGDLTNGLLDLGVGQCESLQQLELTARSSSKVGDAGVKALADGRLNCTLQFLRLKNFLDLISPEAVTYLRNKFNGREIHIC